VPTITEPAMMRLVSYPWPGNVRELMNVVQRMIVMNDSRSTIDVRDVPEDIRSPDTPDDNSSVGGGAGGLAGVGLDKLEKEAIRQTLGMTAGNREHAAKLLGIGERTLYRKLKEYGLR
jgi:two-component system response regulator HydG